MTFLTRIVYDIFAQKIENMIILIIKSEDMQNAKTF